MKKFILLTFIYLGIFNLNAQQISSNDSVVVSLITCSPGEEIYSKFGHTAIRLKDVSNGIDVVFNYGVFSFDTEDFYYKFVKGETDYQLGVYDSQSFLPEYVERNSMVWEQVLNLTTDEKMTLIKLLETNYEPQNRLYRYNFVFDNCSTRPRDKIVDALDGFIRYGNQTESKTFRSWVGNYVGTDTWLKYGIDLLFGVESDELATQTESMFLPEIFMSEFERAQVVSFNGEKRKLVAQKNILVQRKETKEPTSNYLLQPMAVSLFFLIIAAIVTLFDIKNKRYNKKFDTVLFLFTGIVGCVIFYVMLFSVHPLVKSNFNILWLNPLNILLAVFIWFRKMRKLVFYFEILNIVLLVGSLFVFPLSIQDFNVATFPFIVLLLMRSSLCFHYTKRKLIKNHEFKQKTSLNNRYDYI